MSPLHSPRVIRTSVVSLVRRSCPCHCENMAQSPGSGDSKTETPAYVGTISSLRRSFGFIKSISSATDVFFHHSACLQDDLAADDSVEFTIDTEQQQSNKTVAARVWRTSKQPGLTTLDCTPHFGCLVSYQSSPQCGSGVLQYMDQQGRLQQLTFNQQDLASSVDSRSVKPGVFVKFKILCDNKQKAQAHPAALSGHRIHHSYLRATGLELLSHVEQVTRITMQLVSHAFHVVRAYGLPMCWHTC